MVVGEKHYKHTDEGPVKNMRRNRSPPRNSEDGAGTSNNEAEACEVREGPEYQATLPEYNPSNQSLKVVPDSTFATILWAPHPRSLDRKVELFIQVAKEKHRYDEEQALALLFWHGHNVDRALADLANFVPFVNDWTVDDMVLFEQAFHFHGKNFHRIHLMLPEKSIGSLVKYYYLWKKIQYRISVLDNRAERAKQCGNGGEKEAIGDSDSDFESAKEPVQKEDGTSTEPVRAATRGKTESHGRLRNRHKPPTGIYVNYDDLKVMASRSHGQMEAFRPLEMELESLKRRVIANRQELGSVRQRTSIGIDLFRPPENQAPVNPKWTHSELLLAVQGIRRYGKNFAAIAELLGTKTEHLVENFFYNYRVQYSLDRVLQEYEIENGKNDDSAGVDDGPTDMEVDCGQSSGQTNPLMSSPPPPPLMKQFSSDRHGSHGHPESVQKPPVLQQAVKSTSSSGRMILHQPPPLFKHGTSLPPTTTASVTK